MKTKIPSQFETEIEALLGESKAQRELQLNPSAVLATNATLAQVWKTRGIPAVERLKEIARSSRFKNAEKLHGADWESLFAAGAPGHLIDDVKNYVGRVMFLHKALAQLEHIGEAIAGGVDPDREGAELIGCKHSDYILTELQYIENADKDILDSLGALEHAVSRLCSGPRLAGSNQPIDRLPRASYSGNPTQAITE
jgi:hypothetical protein